MTILEKTWPTTNASEYLGYFLPKQEATNNLSVNLWLSKGRLEDSKGSLSFYFLQTESSHKGMRREFEAEKRIELLEKQMSELASKIDSLIPQEIRLRDIDHVQAKKEIKAYFKKHHGEKINPADIEEALGIEITMAIDICEELEREGKIKGL